MNDSGKRVRFCRVTFGVIVYGLIVAGVSLCAISLGARIIAPEVFDNFPPPPPDLRAKQDLLGIAFVISGLAIGILAVLRRLRAGDPVESSQCRKCGYNLTGNVSGVCPECGEKI